MKPLLICSALKDELAPLRTRLNVEKSFQQGGALFQQGELDGCPVILGWTGVGPKAGEAGLTMLLDLVRVSAVLGVGYAGSLNEEVPAEALIQATEIVTANGAGGPWQADTGLREKGRTILGEHAETYFEGRIVSADHVLSTAQQKKDAGEAHDAIAVDMESAAWAKTCTEREIPFLILRAILDPVEMSLPDTESFINKQQRVAKRQILSYAVNHPEALWELPRLGAYAHRARKHLVKVVPELVRAILDI